jgi:UDP-N-acetylglucosamine acyltransferase
MSAQIHPLAAVDPGAVLGDGVRIGPFAVVGPEVEIGDGTEVGAGAQVYGPAKIGRGNRIFPQACVGFEPQDVKFGGERVTVEIGDRNQFREMCTVHRGTAKGGGVTRIGSDNLFLAYSHVAHDCQVGNRTLFVNNATLAGHVEVHDDATVGAFSSVHQFCRVGRHAYIGGYSVITMDALPFTKTVGIKPAFYGVNKIGLSRKGVGAETIRRLERALRLLVRSGLNTAQALEKIREELSGDPDVEYLVSFIASAKRGVHKSAPRGGRTGGGDADGD